MSRLKSRIKRVSLAFMGEGWQDCYIDFRALRWKDLEGLAAEREDNARAVDALLSIMRNNFVSGVALGEDGQPLEIAADDLADLDLEALTAISEQLGGQPGPNS